MGEKLTTIAENVPKVYDAGKQAESDDFWDIYQRNGELEDYRYAFAGYGWNKEKFKPKYDIKPTRCDNMFAMHHNGIEAYDLAEHLEKLGIVLDFTKLEQLSTGRVFYYANVSRIPEINMQKLDFTEFFNGCKAETIDKIICSTTKAQTFGSTFTSCTNLKNIRFEGVIQRSISFSPCPLTVESIKSIISCLKDFSGDATNDHKYTLTVKSSAFSALEVEGATAEYNGVACTWAELIDNKKWNLVKA
jgi:hypothetical protein